MAVAPGLAATAPPPELGPLIGAILQQVLTGLVLGFLTQLLFAAVQAAGELVDLFSGFTIASVYDPLSNVSSTMFGRLQQLIAVTLLFAVNGHLLLVRGFLNSYEAVPLRADTAGLAELFVHELGTFFVSALEIAAPLVVVLFLAELSMGLIGRAAPSLNVFSTSFPLKILLVLSFAGLTFTMLPGIVKDLVRAALEAGDAASRMLA
jgi:flagellar biosynthetic protein FliR